MSPNKKTLVLGLLAVPALVLLVGCSDDDDPVTPPPDPGVTETIGAAGGTLAMSGELTMVVPPGALADDVEFKAGPADSPPALPDGYVAVSEFYDIEPGGTTFADGVSLTLYYDESAIPQFVPEDELYVYTHDGTAWSDLDGPVDENADAMTVSIDHLSVFVVAAPEPEPAADVYLEFHIERHVTGTFNGPTFEGYDTLGARFAANAPTKIEDYLYAGDVSYGPWDLVYGMGSYYYSNDDTPMFFDFGTNYDLMVGGSLEVTPLTLAVATMAPCPVLSNVADDDELPLDGFEVTWDGTGASGSVEVHLDSYQGGAIFRTDANDGSYTFTAQDLMPLSAGEGEIRLVWLYETPLPGEGYLDASRTYYETSHTIPVVFTGGGSGSVTRMESNVADLAIPDATTGGPGTPVSSVINMPVTGTIESVRVYLDIEHQWISDLICKLRSPDGTELRVLFIGEGGETDGRTQGWYPDDFTPKDDLGQLAGESAGGDWTLICQDYSYDAAGTLKLWRMEVTYH